MAASPRLLGMDIGGTKCAVLVGTTAGAVLARREWPAEAERGPAAMLEDIYRHADDVVAECGEVAAVGVSIGGPLDAASGIVCSPPNLPGWDNIDLRTILGGRYRIPIGIEHDAAACALAEYEWGLGRTPKRLVYLTCATGFGAGMVFNGEPYYGVLGRSPEIGHVLLDPDGPEAFGIRGCAEAFCSARSLGRIASWKYPQRWPEHPTPKAVQDLAEQGDADAVEVIAINARMTGRVCALLADLIHPDHIALGSLARYLGEPWIEDVRRECRRLALPEAAEHCRIEGARLGDRLQDLSTLAAAIRVLKPARTV